MRQLISEQNIEKTREALRWYQQKRRWFKLGESALRTIYFARQGGPMAVAAACVSMGASVVDAAFPETSLDESLRRRGYHLVNTSIGKLLCDLLDKNETPTAEIERLNETARIWEHHGVGAASIYSNSRYESGPFVLGGDESLLLDAVARCVWGHGNDLMLTAKSDRNGFDLVPIPDPGPYIGEPGPEYYAERLAKYGGRPRTLLIKGPTGIGKSVLARRVATLASCGTARTLKVSSSVLKDFGSAELRDLAKYVQPSVLLLDDLDIRENGGGNMGRRGGTVIDQLLDTLEALRVEGCLVIITMMVDTDRSRSKYRGDNYVEGMRPGRIDEIVTLYVPEEKERSDILQHYYAYFGVDVSDDDHKHVIRMSKGLSGAYLREVVERLSVHGCNEFKREIEDILQSAPEIAEKVKKTRRNVIRRRQIRRFPTPAQLRQRAKRLERGAEKAVPRAEKRRVADLKKAEKNRKRADVVERKNAEDKARAKARLEEARTKARAKAKAEKAAKAKKAKSKKARGGHV